MTTATLSLHALTKRFGSFQAVKGIDLEVRNGEILALIGPSGCGKTTTLRMVAGLEQPSAGEIFFGDTVFYSSARGIELPPDKRNIGMVFQSYALWPHLTVFENIAYPLRVRGVRKSEIWPRVQAVLALINLTHLMDKTIPLLSGGQQQRVALARALVYEPSLMLFDEPFSGLDAHLRNQMRMELKTLRRKVAMTGLFVTHDQIEALSVADRVAIMNGGVIEQVGEPQDVYRHPKTKFVRDFLGRVVTLHGPAERRGTDALVRLPQTESMLIVPNAPLSASSNATSEVAIRPEFIRLLDKNEAEAPNTIQATVEDLLFTGERFEARLRIGAEHILFDLPPSQAWREGDEVRLTLPSASLSIWPTESQAA